ncbi:hypothetical protein RB623_03180 [Mesorhizobium sp. LHD-90]|uniref:hypothetical protein n=1 Tax=Mesorhizobium sp. LHD-90 TaxID=3071414 RepID=UPI0027E01C20|nr:hypothetical protein [Mesorhizobium sp. LHD-90]MDQ6433053.1 hypothetical protein [Mesorhizobium sp. LHD-90]
MAKRSTKRLHGATTLASDLMLAPMVMWMRLPLLAAEAKAGPAGVETMRAVTEKSLAVAQGVAAAQVSMAGAAMRFWPELLSGRTPSMLTGVAAEQALHAALKPIGTKVKANYRRLSARSRDA